MEKKTVVIINGAGGTGKDTLCEITSRHYKTRTISAVDRVKEIALFGGWNGVKDDRGRKLLSDIKQAFVDYDDLPRRWLVDSYREFLTTDERIMFIHCREPEEIQKLKEAIPGSLALLVRRPGAQKHFGNASDDRVEAFEYDFIYENNKTLADVEEDFLPTLRKILEA